MKYSIYPMLGSWGCFTALSGLAFVVLAAATCLVAPPLPVLPWPRVNFLIWVDQVCMLCRSFSGSVDVLEELAR